MQTPRVIELKTTELVGQRNDDCRPRQLRNLPNLHRDWGATADSPSNTGWTDGLRNIHKYGPNITDRPLNWRSRLWGAINREWRKVMSWHSRLSPCPMISRLPEHSSLERLWQGWSRQFGLGPDLKKQWHKADEELPFAIKEIPERLQRKFCLLYTSPSPRD